MALCLKNGILDKFTAGTVLRELDDGRTTVTGTQYKIPPP
jgi:hypothetical protein